jgi:hypothetical protein
MNPLFDLVGALFVASVEGKSRFWWILPAIWVGLFGAMSVLAAAASNVILAVIFLAIAASLPLIRLRKMARLSSSSDRARG